MITWTELEKKHPELLTLKKSPIWPESEIDEGWHQLIDDFMNEAKEKDILPKDWNLEQLKEKFGLLRLYCSPYTLELQTLITEYEHKSGTICETCGESGTLRTDLLWVKTLCVKHYNEKIKTEPHRRK